MKKIVLLLALVGLFASCATKKNSNISTVMLTGKITALGITTFQYGTHMLKVENKIYALRSATIKLDNYVNKLVTLKGEKISGYPIENGPELIDVSEISFK
ncbi:hypothetical protein [Sphingobacterium kitahiroshimense]|uniref:Uncharacterized protein n=1 Tax=Sphingobacterium kitahiroshimense TaxID=470446 RepID=A0ABV0BQ22_9SPHI